jgi:hypothetical protein
MQFAPSVIEIGQKQYVFGEDNVFLQKRQTRYIENGRQKLRRPLNTELPIFYFCSSMRLV